MKSLKSRLRKHEAAPGGGGGSAGALTADWNKYDDRLMKAAERGDVEKLSSVLAKKGVNPTKLDVEGRSVFHVIASKGNLDCLNVILIHGVDIVATDVAGRNALHLAAKYGHALCLQKLLQYNCPTENVDLQGRTALHDAAMSDCSSSVQLLCDHGASVNAKDTDGRTPLVLATQMCHPLICQLLLDRGADVNARDKQNRTALMLGCEYGCKDAVEVLLRNGADVTLVDGLGHDCSYYARIGDNVGILALVKVALEEANKASYEVMKKGQPAQKVLPKWSQPGVSDEASFKPYQKEHRNVQELERANEDLKGRLREIQQEHRILLDRINGLQLQLNEEQMVADDLESEKDELRRLLAAKEKQQEESGRLLEALKLKLRFYESDHGESGSSFGNRKEAALLKSDSAYLAGPQHAPASAPAGSQSRSMVRPLELLSQPSASETEALKRELSSTRSCYEAARADVGRLQLELAHKAAECKALASECERSKLESDRQIKQLEDALKDVQKRMFDSEGKVKQMQAHFLALKEHLAGEAVAGSSQLAGELRDVKAKYEGASAEVGKLRNQLKQNELLVEEFRRDEARLVEENKRMQKELGMLRTERENSERRVSESESQLKETAARLTDKFEKMKSSLSVEIDEKSWRLAEVEKEREKLSTEVQALRAELESQKAQSAQYVRPEEFRHVKSRYEQRTRELERAHLELQQKNQALQKEVERASASSSLLKQQVGSLRSEMRTQYVPLKVSEEMKKASDATAAELSRQLAEVAEEYRRSKAESEKLLAEKACLRETVGRLQTAHVPLEAHAKENEALKAAVSDLQRQLAELGQKHTGEQAKALELASENETLRNAMKERYVPVEAHKETQAALNSLLEKAGQELTDLKGKMAEVTQELAEVNEENGALKAELGALRSQIESDCLSTRKHHEVVAVLNKTIQELRESSSDMQAKYKEKQDEVAQLHAEVAAQKQELDTIQECIRSKYAPLINLEEKERHFEATVKELRSQLLRKEQQHREQEEELKARSQDNERLRAELLALQADLQQNYVPAKVAREAERALEGRAEGLSRQLGELRHGCAEAEQEAGRLREECARLRAEALEAQARPGEQAAGLERRLEGTIEGLRGELGRETARCEQERRTAQALRQELEQLRAASVPLAEHERVKGALEREASAAGASLRAEQAEGRARREEISRLQAELQSARRAVQELEAREVVALSEHQAVTCRLEGQVLSMAEELGEELEGMQEEARPGKAEELPVKDEQELLQPRSVSIEQEIKDQKERCDKSLSTIAELQRRMQESAKQVEAKDNKITELLNDVERLKQALHGLSQLTYNGSIPAAKRQTSQVEMLQTQVKALQQQLADAERQHQEVISTYRTHLLSAVQGHMDEDVQAALLQIIRMRQGLVC